MTSLTTKPHDRPVFILATPRSGTTIIQRCLNLSPELMIWGEHGGFLKQVRLAYRRVTQYRMLERFGVHDADTKRRVMAGEPVLFDGRWSTEWMSPFSSEIAYYAHRDFLLQLFARDVPPEIRWGFKEVQYGYRDVRFLSEMFPGAQFVFPLRSPFETMLSKVRAFDSGQLEAAPLDLYIKQYNDALEMVDASHLRADLSALVVPLDGFQSDPVEGTARIARFLGVPPIDKDAILALKAARVGWEGGDQLAEDLRKAVGDDPRFQETAAKYESHVQNANAMANVSAPAAPTRSSLEDHAEPPRWPRISIVVPCFQAAETLERTLSSLRDQGYPALQVIVMDGGSTDGTAEILERWDADLDIWVSEPDRCQAHALNKGFAKAGGEIFGWLCADDELAPGALRRIGRLFAERADVDVVTGGCQRDFNEGANRVQTTPDPRYYERLDFMNTIEQPSTFWRAASHRAAGKLDETYRYAFDWEFWCRLKRVGARFHAIDDILSVYYFSDDNLTSSGGQKIADEMYRVIKTYGPYQGRIADVYRFLFRTFDMRGYYDADTREQIPKWKRGFFYGVLRALYVPFDRETVNSYNWNFASRQERGLGW